MKKEKKEWKWRCSSTYTCQQHNWLLHPTRLYAFLFLVLTPMQTKQLEASPPTCFFLLLCQRERPQQLNPLSSLQSDRIQNLSSSVLKQSEAHSFPLTSSYTSHVTSSFWSFPRKPYSNAKCHTPHAAMPLQPFINRGAHWIFVIYLGWSNAGYGQVLLTVV